MPRAVKIVSGILGMVVIIALAVMVIGLRLLKKSQPQTVGTVVVQGLHQPVSIYRDAYGVPHLFANNEDDLFFAQGYVHAQDRLWQMDLNRRAALGTLSEILGPRTIDYDKLIRTINLPAIANQLSSNLSRESQRILTAYAAGVNAFLKQQQQELPFEFIILDYRPEVWEIDHSLAYQRLVAWLLEMAWRVDPVFGQIVMRVGPEAAQEIFPDYPDSSPSIIRQSVARWSDVYDLFHNFSDNSTGLASLFGPGLGSNSWVVGGSRTLSGKPLLANDPHLGHQNPGIWYEVHLNAPGIDGYGVSFPGLPGIVIGHNPSIAWGLTNVMADGCDFFIEKLNPVNPNQYWFRDSWHDITVTEIEIPVKGQPPIKHTIRATQHGPIVSKLHPLLQDTATVVAMKWSGQSPSDELLAFYRIMKAGNWDQFVSALRHFSVPPQNWIYADREGNIGYYCAGSIPIRKQGNGLLPQPGWTGDFEWLGQIPFDRLPHLYNPIEGVIVTANNKVTDSHYPYFISTYWEPPYRAHRIQELLAGKNKLQVSDFKAIQLDVFSVHAQHLMPVIQAALPMFDRSTKLRAYFASSLKDWDFQSTENSIGATIFEIFLTHFIKNIFQDELGDTLYAKFIELPNIPIRITDQLVAKGQSIWFDDKLTPDSVETLNDIVVLSLEEAFSYLCIERGEIVYNWRWGSIHQVKFEHALARGNVLDRWLNIGPAPIGGSNTSINAASYSLDRQNFRTVVGPSMRQIADLSNRKKSLLVIPTGQSGHPFSRHYRDQYPLWLSGGYHATLVDSAQICNSNLELLMLTPAASTH